jgi:NADPH2:quinone reductase
MRAIRFHELGEPEVLRLEDVPDQEPAAGEALIEVHAAGVNFADTRRRRGLYLEETPLPYTPGSEVAGRIVRLGEGVSGWSVGDRVMATLASGGYAEYVTVSAAALLPIPAGLGYAEAAAFPVQGLTAYHLLRTSGRLRPGESALVHSAAGGVGTLAVQLARLMGAGTIYATASSDEKLALARSLGADVTVNYTTEEFAARVVEHARSQGRRGVDIILDAVGGDVLEQSLRCLAPFGRLVVFGRASGHQVDIDPAQLMKRCQEMIGFWLPPILARPDLVAPSVRELSEYLASGQLKVLVGASFPLEQAAEAHRQMEARQTTGKVVLLVRP